MTEFARGKLIRRRSRGNAGFTLIELIAVVVIIGTLAGVAIPALANASSSRRAAAARLVVHDLGYARERAVAAGLTTWVVFSVAGDSYALLEEPRGSPGRAGAQAITLPGASAALARTFAQGEFLGVEIASADFDDGAEVGFDWLGHPVVDDDTALAADGAVTIEDSLTVRVEAGTGLAWVED